jgi:large subunit ribosomal protein L2
MLNIIKKKPIINSLRHKFSLNKSLLSKTNILSKKTINGCSYSYGRCFFSGRITSWHKGGGTKPLYRKIEFSTNQTTSIIVSICYDPLRSALINLNFDFEKKRFFRTLATHKVFVGALIVCASVLSFLRLGCRTFLSKIPGGILIHSLNVSYKQTTKYIKSAGTFGQLLQFSFNKGKVKLPSNKIVSVSSDSIATLGKVSNTKHFLTTGGKAGNSRNLGRRPIVRGIAMNPVDHPHGGRSNGGRPSVTPWGLPTKSKFKLKKK